MSKHIVDSLLGAVQQVHEKNEAYRAGQKAREEGKTIRDNPYETGTPEKIYWIQGYRAQRKADRKSAFTK